MQIGRILRAFLLSKDREIRGEKIYGKFNEHNDLTLKFTQILRT